MKLSNKEIQLFRAYKNTHLIGGILKKILVLSAIALTVPANTILHAATLSANCAVNIISPTQIELIGPTLGVTAITPAAIGNNASTGITLGNGTFQCISLTAPTDLTMPPCSPPTTTVTAPEDGSPLYISQYDLTNDTYCAYEGILTPTAVSAIAFEASTPTAILDVDANGEILALSDGLLSLRYLFGFRGDALINQALGADATRITAAELELYFNDNLASFDIDGNGETIPLTDGLLFLRYLFGFRGDALINQAIGPNASRTTALDIESYIQNVTPTLSNSDFERQAYVLKETDEDVALALLFMASGTGENYDNDGTGTFTWSIADNKLDIKTSGNEDINFELINKTANKYNFAITEPTGIFEDEFFRALPLKISDLDGKILTFDTVSDGSCFARTFRFTADSMIIKEICTDGNFETLSTLVEATNIDNAIELSWTEGENNDFLFKTMFLIEGDIGQSSTLAFVNIDNNVFESVNTATVTATMQEAF